MITNVELDHHARWASRAELVEAFRSFAGGAAGLAMLADPSLDRLEADQRTSRFDAERPGPPLRLAVPGSPQPAQRASRTRGRRARRARLARRARDRLAELSRECGRRLERKGSRNGAEIYDDYAHHPTEVAATLAALRELEPRRLIAVFQPHLYSRTKALAVAVRRGARRRRRDRRARRLPGARGAGRRARRRQRPRRRSRRRRPAPAGVRSGGCATPAPPSARWRRGLREGDLLVTLGAGDIHQLRRASWSRSG